MEHLADELDLWRLVGVLLFKLHDESEGSVLKGRVCGADNDGVPECRRVSTICCYFACLENTDQVMTLSGMGDAETPAGGSVCMRWERLANHGGRQGQDAVTNLEVTHQTASSGCRHDGG